MSRGLTDHIASDLPAAATSQAPVAQREQPANNKIFAYAAWHSLAWLVFANGVGVLIAALLVFPRLNSFLGEWTYGRWMPVHMNLQLYGWCSLPLVAFLFKVYGADREHAAQWCRPALWVWSSALTVGSITWLTGHSSGKLFLDWSGYSRALFPLALFALWLVLALALFQQHDTRFRLGKTLGLILLLAVPVLIYIAADPNLYPPINPDSGGPTGASQLESALVVVAILLLLPFGLTRRKAGRPWRTTLAWSVLGIEALLCLGLGRADVSHHRPTQYISLGSLLVWLPLTPIYYGAFEWHPSTRRWRIAFLCWWSILVPTGWTLFLPGVLDHVKFTDGLVAHSLLAMAGFTSSLLIFVMVQLLGEEGWIFNRDWSFYLWQGSVAVYIALMGIAGWREGTEPAFAFTPGLARNSIYLLRLLLGIFMLAASAEWMTGATKLVRETAPFQETAQ